MRVCSCMWVWMNVVWHCWPWLERVVCPAYAGVHVHVLGVVCAPPLVSSLLWFVCPTHAAPHMVLAACGCVSYPGKAMDAYAPIGPAIVTTDEIGDPHTLGIRCFLNGATVQVCAR